MVEQKPTTINIDLRLKSGQQTLNEFATTAATAAKKADVENPLPTVGKSTSGLKNEEKKLPSILEPISKPAYPGAKHDVRGFCVRHPRCRLVRSVDGKEDGGSGEWCRVLLLLFFKECDLQIFVLLMLRADFILGLLMCQYVADT